MDPSGRKQNSGSERLQAGSYFSSRLQILLIFSTFAFMKSRKRFLDQQQKPASHRFYICSLAAFDRGEPSTENQLNHLHLLHACVSSDPVSRRPESIDRFLAARFR